MFVESSYRHHIVSKRGAVGIMQVKPQTASEMFKTPITAEMLKDSAFCHIAGVCYMNKLRGFWRCLGYESLQLEQITLMSYNEGPGLTINRHYKGTVRKALNRAYWHYDNHQTFPKALNALAIPKVTKYVRDILCTNL
jgi:hypothetical protein